MQYYDSNIYLTGQKTCKIYLGKSMTHLTKSNGDEKKQKKTTKSVFFLQNLREENSHDVLLV